MENKVNIKFKSIQNHKRIDLFLKESLPYLSRSQIDKLFLQNLIKLNGQIIQKKNKPVHPDDEISIEFLSPQELPYSPSQKLIKLYEDPYLIIIDKPQGLSVHPGAGVKKETVLDIFLYHYPQVQQIKNTDRPGIVHRLDKETSGTLILAKDEMTMLKMQKQFKKRLVKKTYMAFVEGNIRFRHGIIDSIIGRDPQHRRKFSSDIDPDQGRQALTEYNLIGSYTKFSFVRLHPITGRTHQLRVHLAWAGHPILGDSVYGHKDLFPRLALHAYSISFIHPQIGWKISAYSPLPLIFCQYLQQHLKNK